MGRWREYDSGAERVAAWRKRQATQRHELEVLNFMMASGRAVVKSANGAKS